MNAKKLKRLRRVMRMAAANNPVEAYMTHRVTGQVRLQPNCQKKLIKTARQGIENEMRRKQK